MTQRKLKIKILTFLVQLLPSLQTSRGRSKQNTILHISWINPSKLPSDSSMYCLVLTQLTTWKLSQTTNRKKMISCLKTTLNQSTKNWLTEKLSKVRWESPTQFSGLLFQIQSIAVVLVQIHKVMRQCSTTKMYISPRTEFYAWEFILKALTWLFYLMHTQRWIL